MKKCRICEKGNGFEKMRRFKIIWTLWIFMILSSISLFAQAASIVEANYSCRTGDIQKTIVSDINSDGIYDTYTVEWCDGSAYVYPICAIGDIRRWPPRGIPTREITSSDGTVKSFTETYTNQNSSNQTFLFIRLTNSDSVYFYDYFNPSEMVSGINDNSTPNLSIDLQPNPTKDIINISYHIKTDAWVSITLYNEIGILVDEFENVYQYPGSYSLVKNLSDLPNGIYFITTKLGIDEIITRKIIISK